METRQTQIELPRGSPDQGLLTLPGAGLGGVVVLTWLVCLLPVGGTLSFPLFCPRLVSPELSWHYDGSCSNCDVSEIITIL